MRGVSIAWLLLLVAAAAPKAKEEFAFIENDRARLGVKLTSGAAIGHFSAVDSDRNLLNHFDHGRLVQQSYYGDEDGSRWNKQPWRWNPVQGGDWRGTAATVLELKREKTTLYAKTRPRHWASGADLPDVTMEQWITLDGPAAHVRYRMTYTGEKRHKPRPQELPAVFIQPDLSTFVLYDGKHPWTGKDVSRSKPGWPNESRKMTENWAAYVDEKDFGVGAYVPVADELTCYRYKGGNNSDCSYFAPVKTFAITPGLAFEYDVYLTFGTVDQIRARFAEIRAKRPQ
jgi:hypothetical protein